MQKKILLVQFRNDHSYKDELFCFSESLNQKITDFECFDACKQNNELNLDSIVANIKNYKLVIFGGSGVLYLSKLRVVEQRTVNVFNRLILEVIQNHVPSIAICYGHQLLGIFLGSKVVPHIYLESGNVKVSKTPACKKESLLKNLPDQFLVNSRHKDGLQKVPKGCELLLTTDKCPVNAFKYENIYSFQFHPELNSPKSIKRRQELYKSYDKGLKKEEVESNLINLPHAKKLMQNVTDYYLT